MSHANSLERAQSIREAREALQFACATLNPTQRAAIRTLVNEGSYKAESDALGLSRAGVWMARGTALNEIRRRLKMIGITSPDQLVMDSPPGPNGTSYDAG